MILAVEAFQTNAFQADAFQVFTPDPVPPGGYGDYADAHKRSNKRRADELAREREEKQQFRKLIAEKLDPTLRIAKREREELLLLIEQAVDPIKARSARVIETEAEDGTTGVAIVTRGRQTAVPVPAAFDASEVVAMVAAALERAGIEARRVATEQARRKAVAALESAIQERQRLILKRRREEEILLLM